MTSLKLDKYDRKLLFQLDSDARMSYVQLAKHVGLSKDSIKNRINNYMKAGLIGGFYPLIDSSKLGFYSFRAYFAFKKATLESKQKVIRYLMSEKNVFYLNRVEGSFDIGVGYFAKTLVECKEFFTELKEKFPCIDIMQEGIFIKLYHFDRNYFIDKNRLQAPKAIIQEPSEVDIDETDTKILQLLSEDARISIVDISQKVKFTSKAIIYRIKNLKKRGIILGYKPKINLDKIGYSLYKVDLYLEDKSTKEMIRRFVFQLPNIIHSEDVFGGSDLEFDIECSDYLEFQNIMNIIIEKFGKDITKITHYRTCEIYKTTYFPLTI